MNTVLDEDIQVDLSVPQQISSGVETGRQPALRGYGRVLAAVVALLIVGGALVGFSGEARHQLALSFTRQPTQYAELYFSGNPTTLLTRKSPTALGAGFGEEQVQMNVTFTVANHDGETSAFPYEVEVVDDTRTTLGRADGSVTVHNGSAQPTAATVDFVAAEQWSAVEVRLIGRGERIRILRAE